ncbi:eukaryotic translation initiation factor 2B delta subunit [Sistotremastrum niveocremeum HHB9708]|uniref:Translation initiation factor eIF2B subunit delta n=1 Tax=Sistotremastrum niveocremeum HHB9708 TaxID=1314777 RepID=A0A164ZUI2_9AGAM|nr:eukaryotic translation initiation factor 2B delta subunit [Sistotremastrum niveocremeum HHB9708]
MSKQERRELQEKQRAAKEVAKAQPAKGAKAANKPSQASQDNQSSKKLSKAAEPSTPSLGASASAKSLNATSASTSQHNLTGTEAFGLRIFSHFGAIKHPSGPAKGDIHPAIVRLGRQFAEFAITGANARCIATLTAFQSVIQDYSTPPNTTLSRHLTTHLSHQINHLVGARPMSVSMANAIKHIKVEITNSDIDMPEQNAKDELCHKIDLYIRDRIIVADKVIRTTALRKIQDGDTILTYARSSVVEKVLLYAHSKGREFSVIVVDSRPMLEGKGLLSKLSSAGIRCTYILLPALPSIIDEVNIVFVGAHSMLSNGAVFSRAGTAMVAMMAQERSIPFVVCCETYKYSEGIHLDSFTKNELAPLSVSIPAASSEEVQSEPNLQILNPLYDLTPPTNITAVVTEVGVIPPSSVSSLPFALGRQFI